MKNTSFFRSSGFIQNSIVNTESNEYLDLKEIPNFLRTLLVTDGTVTKSLEAWFWEKVNVVPKKSQIETLESEIVELGVNSGKKVLQREVILQGQSSNNIFASASSTVLLKHLPQDVAIALENGEIGIGELLRKKGIETYRDIFNINYIVKSDSNNMLVMFESEKILTRSYRIWVNAKPAIIVTEYFPIDVYQ